MRRPSDFVLEKAGWPALLLEEDGTICRANRAASQLLGPVVQGIPGVASFASLLDDSNAIKLDRFLADQAGGQSGDLKLNVLGGQKVRFQTRVTKIARDGQNYFVLQLFNGPGTAFSDTATWFRAKDGKETAGSAPTAFLDAMEVPFALTNSDWPAMVLDKMGTIIRSNPACARVFGAAARKSANLGVIWPADNAVPLETFLASPANTEPQPVKLRAESGTIIPFQAHACPAAQSKWVLLQLFKESAAVSPNAAAPAPSSAHGAKGASEKTGDEFLLQDADWPAFLTRKNGQVLRANRAAVRAFGSGFENQNANLGTIWSPENRDSAEQFLSLPAPSKAARLKFRLKSGLPGVFLVQLSFPGPHETCLVQLLKEPSPAAPAASGKAAPGPAESHAIQRQKLDCALQLARSVALDFNNALTSILGHTSLLLSQADPEHPWRGSLVQIEKSAAKAAEVANDLGTFSLKEKDTRSQTAGNLNTLLERTLEALQNSLPRPVTITQQWERKLFTVNFDEAKMQQALVRILENAVEAIPADGKITVETRNMALTQPTQEGTAKLNAGHYVCVEISDNGSGISEEVMPHVFEPFYTTKGSKHRGLGLAWVYGIVTNHGGGVAISSIATGGARVRLYLPANAQIVREAPLALTELRGSQTILVVDDEDLLLTMAQMVLSSFGYTVLTANSGQKALELFLHWKDSIELFLVDLVMPNMSGRELTEQIRKLSPRARILWCSGYVRSAHSEDEGSYLQKPFTSQDLLRAVKHALADEVDAPAPQEAGETA